MTKSIELLLTTLCHQQLLTNLLAVNIALKKNAKDCKNRYLESTILDGIHNPKSSVQVEKDCNGMNSFVEVWLMGYYVIHYVIVYAGEDIKDGQLDYFQVDLEDGRKQWICGEYPEPISPDAEELRVNCKHYQDIHTGIKVRSRKNHGLSISEIEVHTLIMQPTGERLRIFRGCFGDLDEDKGIISQVAEPVHYNCHKKCADNRTVFYAIKQNSLCVCHNEYVESGALPPETCNIKCEDGRGSCGGDGVHSVYLAHIALPTYYGCLEAGDIPEDALTGEMTIDICLKHCETKLYAVLQEGNRCFCQEGRPANNDIHHDRCTVKCTGNAGESCGGHGFASIYETCLKPSPSVPCSKLFRCDDYDKHGVCKSGCKPGFTGEYCFGRGGMQESLSLVTNYSKITKEWISGVDNISKAGESRRITSAKKYTPKKTELPERTTPPRIYTPKTVIHSFSPTSAEDPRGSFTSLVKPVTSESISFACKDGNLCINIMNTECVLHNGRETCQCKTGYSKNDSNSQCTDIDECVFEPCNTKVTICKNTNGSYFCECKIGYKRVTEELCLYNETLAVDLGIPRIDLLNHFLTKSILLPLLSMMILTGLLCYNLPQKSSDISSTGTSASDE